MQPEDQERIEVCARTGELMGAVVEALEQAGLETLKAVQGIQVEAQAKN